MASFAAGRGLAGADDGGGENRTADPAVRLESLHKERRRYDQAYRGVQVAACGGRNRFFVRYAAGRSLDRGDAGERTVPAGRGGSG